MNTIASHYKFGLDFGPVRTIPEDPRERLPYFTAFRELLEREKEKIKDWHRTGVGGREVIQAHTCLIDESIRQIIETIAAQEKYASAPVLEEFALVAVGGYGRGELNPRSDIDLLFLRPRSIRRATDDFIQEVISVFWGIGMEIGQSCRTIKDCLVLAANDLTVKTAMIETRFLIGDTVTYEKFCQSVRKNILNKNVTGFLKAKSRERQFSNLDDEKRLVCCPEPNIKEGAGGLRDYHTALWAVAVRFGCLSFQEIPRNDIISPAEVDLLNQSLDFLLRVRNELHYLQEKKTDVLSLPIQKDLALNLGYSAGSDAQSVERFMRDYFLHATNIHRLSEGIFQRCIETKPSIKKVISSLTRKSLGNGFHAVNLALTVNDQELETLFQTNKNLLLTLFDLCRIHNLEPDYQLKRQIRLHRHLLDEEFLKDKSVTEFLFTTLQDARSEKHLRLMHELGILGQILPEFGQSHCVVSYDFYHRYTADEHSLRMIHFLEELGEETSHGPEEIRRIYLDLEQKVLLKFSALLYSIRRMNGDPEKARDEIFSTIATRLGLDVMATDTLYFLMANLYEMVETALHQDIHQPEVIQAFADKVGSLHRLELLYLASYADLKAVAPDTWTSWKKVLLSELYHRTRDYFVRPESLNEKPRATRDRVYKALSYEFPASEIEHHLNQMPEDYLLTAHSDQVALHIRLIRSLKDKLFIFNHNFNEEGGYHNLILCCPAKHEAFKKLLGTLTAKNLNILGAQIYLRKDQIVIITTQVEDSDAIQEKKMQLWKEVNQVLRDVLEGKKQLPELLASRTRYVTQKKHSTPIIPKIQIDNTGESQFTVIRVEARDHLGMLYKIAKIFADFGIQIHRAKISTKGGRGIDVFYISLKGKKVSFNRLIRRIKERLIEGLLLANPEDIG